MNQIKALFSNLSTRQTAQILAVAILVGMGLWYFVRWQHERDFKPLYTSLSAEDAGAMVRRLKELGVEYKLSDNSSTVLVASEKVAEARLEMAGAGLPKSGRIGFELFDKTNFGMTDFTERVNYRRAVEGELERSVMCLAEVENARVHVTFLKDSVFLESRQPAKASVLLKLRPGSKLSPQNVLAIANLVASAVEGLSPDSVSLVDMRGNLLNRPKRAASPDAASLSDDQLEYQQKIEIAMLAKINSTLEPILGPEKFRAVVSAECDFTGGELSEETYDPSKSVMATSQRSEDIANATTGGGIPGTASSLPRPAPRSASESNRLGHMTENITYQTSRTVRHTKIPGGTIKKLSVSVLLDQAVRWQGKQKIVVPPSPETVKIIKDVVTAAIGFSPGRGDQLTVETLPFESTVNQELLETPKPTASPATKMPGLFGDPMKNPTSLLMLGAAGIVLVLVVRSVLKIRGKQRSPRISVTASTALPQGPRPSAAPAGMGVSEQPESSALDGGEKRRLESVRMLHVPGGKVEVLLLQARDLTKKEADRSALALRDWVEENG